MKKLSLMMMAFAIALFTLSCGSGSSDEKSDDKKKEETEKKDENKDDNQDKDESCNDEDANEDNASTGGSSADLEYVEDAMNALCGCFDELGVSTMEEFAALDGDGQASFDNCMSDLDEDYNDMDAKVEAIGQEKFMSIVKNLPCSKIALKMFE